METRLLIRVARQKLIVTNRMIKAGIWKWLFRGLTFSWVVMVNPSFATYYQSNHMVANSHLVADPSTRKVITHQKKSSLSTDDNSPSYPFSIDQATTYVSYINFAGYWFNHQPKLAGQLGLFAPVWQDPTHLLFIDSSLYNTNRAVLDGNIAIGYRFIPDEAKKDRLFGAFLAYDRIRSPANNDFNQLSFGTEYWHKQLFLGSDVHMPFGSREKFDSMNNSACLEADSDSPYSHIVYNPSREVILPGVELQAGYNFWRGLTLFAGPYYYKSNGNPTVWGPKVRALYQWAAKPHHRILGVINRMGVETQYEHDKPRGSNWYVGVRASIDLVPYGNQNLIGSQHHMIEPLYHEYNATTLHYLEPTQSYTMNGRVANVVSVSNLDEYNYYINDDTVDIIAVDGTIEGVQNTILGDHSLMITGGDLLFSENGQSYDLHNLGHNGAIHQDQLSSDVPSQPLFTIDGDHDITLENLKLTVAKASNGFANNAIYHDESDGSMGNLTINGITSNGGLFINIGALESANIAFDNNNFTVDGAPDFTTWGAAVSFFAENGGEINISSFTHNHIIGELSKLEDQGSFSGLLNFARDGGGITYSGNMINNSISLTSDISQQPMRYYAMANLAIGSRSVINFDREVANNYFTLSPSSYAYAASVLNQATASSGNPTINFLAGFDNNIMDISNVEVSQDMTVGVQTFVQKGTISYAQMIGNKVLSSKVSGATDDVFDFRFENSNPDSGSIIVNGVSNYFDFDAQNNNATVEGASNINNWDNNLLSI